MLLRVLGGGGYLTCHPSTAGGLGKQTHPSLQPRRRVHLMNEASRKWDERKVRARLKRDNDDESHFSPSSPFVRRCRCPETQHICSWACALAHGTIRFVINCGCSDRTMSHSCIQNGLHLLKERLAQKNSIWKGSQALFLIFCFPPATPCPDKICMSRDGVEKRGFSRLTCKETCDIQAFATQGHMYYPFSSILNFKRTECTNNPPNYWIQINKQKNIV